MKHDMLRKSQIKESLLVFAHVPPPDHGQSRMIALMLDALGRGMFPLPVHHVDARYSMELRGVGALSLKKLSLILRYIIQAIRIKRKFGTRTFYYVPGPVKWSAVIRDWITLGVLRRFFPTTVLHWHAIGQGAWAAGSEEVALPGPKWMDSVGRSLSKLVLKNPDLSICVATTTQDDASAVFSRKVEVVSNGIKDPCPGVAEGIASGRVARFREIGERSSVIRLLFLSHGTEEKGLFDALECIESWLKTDEKQRSISLSLAGGISPECELRFTKAILRIRERFSDRFALEELGFIEQQEKADAFGTNDIFLAPSRWESFGIGVVEAMAWSMPIVASFSKGVTGVLPSRYPYGAPVADPEGLAKALGRCVEDLSTERGDHWPRTLRARFEKNFGIDLFNKRISEVLVNSCDQDIDQNRVKATC
ncbi:glycosyltransferase family 4 protein [Haloferula chungangensis]|uniref:Glycosyltransferase family 4 protein n=1 Tax=Haloferula chungangensis TaxID=1048331 RepID=A0ABW2LAS3_9BACT